MKIWQRSVAWISVGTGLCLTAVAVAAEIDTQNWVTLSVGKAFTLRAPPGTKFKPAKGIDSSGGKFVAPQFEIGFDYGPYSNDLSELRASPQFSIDHASVDGRQAIIVTGLGGNDFDCKDILTAMYLVVSRNIGRGTDTRLEISGCTKNPEAIKTLHAIFRSLKFA